MTISPAQCRAARGLLGWSQDELTVATGGGVAKRSLIRFEQGATSPQPRTIDAIRSALEAAGVEFIPENGGGPGVRLRGRET
ncbi:MAG: helix-turn-helix transcriptional regulator [Rhodospirillales bacterium]|nr:helix-turn-helix transcriptional regulator [Rhodospirillales bacterium]